MRTIIQRVSKASVTVGDELISSIGRGLCILVGISKDDTPKEREYLVRKILNLRLFDDENDKRWVKSVRDKRLEILCVSQFTLYSILKGNKPDFHQAMPGDQSEIFYNEFLEMLRKDYEPDKIKDGKFGAHMQVHIQNDGPVTIQLDSPPDSGVSTAQESSGNTDLVRHSRQAPANLKRNHGGLPTSSERFGPLQTGIENEHLENSDGYLACSVCSNGLTHVDTHHLTSTVCGNCGRGLHQDCSALHQCDLNSDTEGTNTKTEGTEVESIMINTPARVCIECQQGGVLAVCTGCDHNLHEVCRAHHECPNLIQRHPTLNLSQVLHKKYSKYGHRANTAKPPQALEPKKSFRLERYKTKKDCCVCSNRGEGIRIRRRSETVCYYCKKGLHWECRFRHNCELMTVEPIQPGDGGSIVIFLTGGNRKRRDCIVCSQRKLGQRHRSRTICKFCKKGLHRKCEHKHLCPWIKNTEEVTENEVHRSLDGIPKKKRKTAPQKCSTLVDSSSSEPHVANQTTTQSVDRSISSANHQLISNTQLNSRIPHNTQQELLSSLQLRPHQPQTNMHETTLAQASPALAQKYTVIARPSTILAQTSTALVTTSPTSMRIENICELNSNAVNQTNVALVEEHNLLQRNAENKQKATIERIPGSGVYRDGRKDCIVCSSRACWGRRKRAYTQCSLCKKGLHFKCRQFHICGQRKRHPKFNVPPVSSAVDKTPLFSWVDKPDGTTGEPQQLSDGFSQGDNPEAVPILVKCAPQCLVDCQECAFYDGHKKMTHLMCSVCHKGVHKKCFYRHRCHRDQEHTEAHAPDMTAQTTGTFVGERPSVVRIQSAEVKDGRKACDVCSVKVRDGKRHRARTQCVVCRRGLHIRCVSQHICPGSSSNNVNNSSFTAMAEHTLPATIPNDVEIKDISEQPSLEPSQQHLSAPSTSTANILDMDHASVPINDRRNRKSQLLKTGQDKFCTVCPSGQKTRMACRLCKENVHPKCEWRHFCKGKDASKRATTPPIIGARFTGEVVPIPSSDVKTRKKDCAVCSNRKAGRRSRSSTMCPHCRKGLHRICAPQHMCPMISPPQDSSDFVEMDTSGNPEPFADEIVDDDDDDMGYVEVTDGITRYCCVCSTSRKSQITRTACSSCDRGLHPQCVLLHNCHSMVPRRLQIPAYEKQASYEGDVALDVEIVRSSTALIDEGETSHHQGDGVHEIIDDEDEDLVEVPTSDHSHKEISEISQTSHGFDTGVTSVSVRDEGKGTSGEVKKYLLVTDDSSEDISRDDEMLSVEDPSEGDSSVELKGRKVGESKEDVDDLRSNSVEDEEHYVLTNSSEPPQVSLEVPHTETQSDGPVTYLLINRNETADPSSKNVDGSSVEVVRPTLTQSELILECSNGPEDMQIGCFSNLENMASSNQIHNEGTAQELDDFVAQIREQLNHVVGDAGHMMDLHQIEGEVLAIQPDGV